MKEKHNWKWVNEDEYHVTYRSDYCGEVQVNKALQDHIEEQTRAPFKGMKNPGEWEDAVWWQGKNHERERISKIIETARLDKVPFDLKINPTAWQFADRIVEHTKKQLIAAITAVEGVGKN